MVQDGRRQGCSKGLPKAFRLKVHVSCKVLGTAAQLGSGLVPLGKVDGALTFMSSLSNERGL